MAAKTSFVTLCNNAKLMLISVKIAQPISFFLPKDAYLGNYKKEGEKYSRVLTGGAKNEMLGPSGSPLCT